MIRPIVVIIFSLIVLLFSTDLLAGELNKNSLKAVRLDAYTQISSNDLPERQIKERNRVVVREQLDSFRIEETISSGPTLEKWTVEQMENVVP